MWAKANAYKLVFYLLGAVLAGALFGGSRAGQKGESRAVASGEKENKAETTAPPSPPFCRASSSAASGEGFDLNIPVLMYHDFTATGSGSQFVMPVALFEEQMKYLADEGWCPVLPDDLLGAAERRQPLPPKAVMLTFDDWYPNQYKLAVPVLEKYNLRGVFFVPSAKIRTEKEKEKLRELHRKGHVIGSHTVHHYYLTKTVCRRASNGCCQPDRACTEEEIKNELSLSREELEAVVGDSVTALAWPGNYFDERTIPWARQEGYKFLFAVEHQEEKDGTLVGIPGVTRNLDVIYRVEIGGQCSLEYFPLSLEDHRCCLVSSREFHRHCRPRENERWQKAE